MSRKLAYDKDTSNHEDKPCSGKTIDINEGKDMSFAGNWDIMLNTPMGAQKGKMAISVDNNTLTGEMTSPIGVIPLQDGVVEGVVATWICKLTKPMMLKLSFNVKVQGDELIGKVKVGPMGESDFTGNRIS